MCELMIFISFRQTDGWETRTALTDSDSGVREGEERKKDNQI